MDLSTDIKSHDFFGGFADDPSQFHFSLGERVLIDEFRSYAKRIIDEDRNIKHFALENSKKKKQIAHSTNNNTFFVPSVGLFFKKNEVFDDIQANQTASNETAPDKTAPNKMTPNQKAPNKNTTNLDLEDLKTKLCQSVRNCLASAGVEETKISQMNTDKVSVKVNDSGLPNGNFECVLCVSSAKSSFKASSKGDNGQVYWILSNYRLHLLRKHKNDVDENEISRKKIKSDAATTSVGDKS